MFTIEIDERASVAVWLFTGATNDDRDFEAYVASLAKLRTSALRAGVGTGLQWVERGNPPPNATWRRRIAEASASYPPNCVFALVSDSAMIRGIATAINWLRPATYDFTSTATFDEAFQWMAARRDGATLATLKRTLATAQARSLR